jgi:hypothetical protein
LPKAFLLQVEDMEKHILAEEEHILVEEEHILVEDKHNIVVVGDTFYKNFKKTSFWNKKCILFVFIRVYPLSW